MDERYGLGDLDASYETRMYALYNGDPIQITKSVKDSSVDCIVELARYDLKNDK